MATTEKASAQIITIEQPQTHRAILTEEALQADTEQRKLLAQFINGHMVEGTDFGKIPGTDKPTLLKPGAEKLVDLFRCTPKFALVKVEEDFERGFFNYMFRVRLYQRDAESVVAEGFGSANSREGRYRWRDAQRKCPKCAKATIFASKNEPGFYCWAKKGGCGAKFGPQDPTITTQVAGKVENDDIATLANTILKMAKKRALVDGAIALARCSDMFTQDVEDFTDYGTPPPADEPLPTSAPPPRSAPREQSAKSSAMGAAAVKDQRADQTRRARANNLWKQARAAGVTEQGFQEWACKVLGEVKSSANLTDEDLYKLESDVGRLCKQAQDELDVPH